MKIVLFVFRQRGDFRDRPKKSLISFFLLCPSFAFAEGDPVTGVFFQAFNFALFCALLIFLTRKPLEVFFKKRKKDFLQFKETARAKFEKASEERSKWQKQLSEVESLPAIRERARREGERLKAEKERELKELEELRQREARFFLQLEKEREKQNMLKKFQRDLALQAEKELRTAGTAAEFQKRLYNGFLKRLEKNA